MALPPVQSAESSGHCPRRPRDLGMMEGGRGGIAATQAWGREGVPVSRELGAGSWTGPVGRDEGASCEMSPGAGVLVGWQGRARAVRTPREHGGVYPAPHAHPRPRWWL